MKSAVILLVATAVILPLIGCGGDDPVAETDKPVAELRKWAESADKAAVQAKIDAYMKVISEKQAEIAAIGKKLLSDGADAAMKEKENLEMILSKLQRNLAVYQDALKSK
jgi:hypothetical protein